MELINLNRVRGNRYQRFTRDLLTCLLDFACNSSFQLDTTTSRVATDKKSSDPLRDVSRKRHFERSHFVQTRYMCAFVCEYWLTLRVSRSVERLLADDGGFARLSGSSH